MPDATAAGHVRSMTGCGTHVLDGPLGRIHSEARSVNHRFLKVSLRVDGPLPEIGLEVDDLARHHVSRGHVSLSLTFTPADATRRAPTLSPTAFLEAAAELSALATRAGLPPVTAADVLALPGLVAARGADESQATVLRGVALQAAQGALLALASARANEGRALAAECRSLLASIADATASLAERAAQVPAQLQQRLTQRLAELLAGKSPPLEPQALAREVALLAEKTDVREELTRLQAHVAHARELLERGGAVGRPLDFLVQELNREANTVGSKANDLDLTRTVIALKTDVERLREQVQNLE